MDEEEEWRRAREWVGRARGERGWGGERARRNVFHFPWEGGSDRAEGGGRGAEIRIRTEV